MPSAHSLVMPNRCITCHMYTDLGSPSTRKKKENTEEGDGLHSEGGHTFRPDDRVCLKCHGTGQGTLTFKLRALKWRVKISLLLKLLEVLLDNAPDKRSKLYRAARSNYDIVVADGGIGVHNPRYAQTLLIYAISSLQAESTGKQ